MSDKLGKSKEFKRLVSMVQQGQQTTFNDIRQYELLGAAAMAMPVGAQRWDAILALCRLIKNTEPTAFEVAEDWIKGELENLPIIAYAEPFGEWWRRHYNLNPIRKAGWLRLNDILGGCKAAVSWYADKAIGIYVVLRAQVPATYAESQPAPQREGGNMEAAQPAHRSTLVQPFVIPYYLQTERAEAILQAVEQLTGRNGQRVLDRSCTPWGFSTYTDWGEVGESLCKKLGLAMNWQDWANLVGVNKDALKSAYHKRTNKTTTGIKIAQTINRLK